MSRKLEDYGQQKSTAITTARYASLPLLRTRYFLSRSSALTRRLAEFLGPQMVKDAGLACNFIISQKPIGAPVTERAVPVAIFQAGEVVADVCVAGARLLMDVVCTGPEEALHSALVQGSEDGALRSALHSRLGILHHTLGREHPEDCHHPSRAAARESRVWLHARGGGGVRLLTELGSFVVQITNPVPRCRHPKWLAKRIAELDDTFKQQYLDKMFTRLKGPVPMEEEESRSQRGGDLVMRCSLSLVRIPSRALAWPRWMSKILWAVVAAIAGVAPL